MSGLAMPENRGAVPAFEDWVQLLFQNAGCANDLVHTAQLFDPHQRPVEAVRYMNRLFSSSAFLLDRFTLNQVGAGLWYLCGSSEYFLALYNQSAPIEDRLAAIRSIYELCRDCFMRGCEEALGHLNEASDNGLNSACYIFWDACQLHPRSKCDWGPEHLSRKAEYELIEDACFEVMERCLYLPHIAVQECALHGLGHWQLYYPQRPVDIIDRWLATNDPDPRIRRYAMMARDGRVQ